MTKMLRMKSPNTLWRDEKFRLELTTETSNRKWRDSNGTDDGRLFHVIGQEMTKLR